ncbi:MAG: hypothetical protein WDA16_09485 [Candidatus Thermoplasmatota archaeon]
MRSGALALVGLLLLVPLLAGCASSPKAQPEQSSGTSVAPLSDAPAYTPPPPKPMGQRWHFHDYWHGTPVITLLDANITLNVSQDAAGLPALSQIVGLPNGVIVPAETGFLTVNVTWASQAGAGPSGGAVNLTYRPADSQSYRGAGNASSGKPVLIFTTASMCDVPHRQESFWRFNLTAVPNGTPPMIPAQTVRLTITATIGRPLFIDPPHVDWWQGDDIIPLIANAKGDIATATTRAGNLTLGGLGGAAAGTPPDAPAAQDVAVPADASRIVPEGAVTLVAILNWTSQAPTQKLMLRYEEANLPSSGAMSITKEGDSGRVFVLSVRPAQTDTTYSNRTTWLFHVVPEGGTGTEAAFQGSFTLVAWVTRLQPADAVKAIVRT